MKKIDMTISVFLIMFGCLYFYGTFGFISSGAALVPRIYAILLITFSLILLIRSFFTKDEFQGGKIKHILLAMGIFVVYIITVPIVGFYLSSLFFIFILLLIRRVKNIYILAGVPIGSIVFIYLFFQKALHVSVPLGFFS